MKKPNSAPPETDPSDLLTNSKTLLTTLLTTHLPQIQTFRSKWSLIKTRLALLNTHLTDFAEFPASLLSNSLSVTLLSSVSFTLAETLSLADKCRLSSDNLTDGKLKTQSDIDSVLARLDRHNKDSEILIRSGVLQDKGGRSGGSNINDHDDDDDAAIASVAGGVASKKEAVRVEMRNLLTRLQIGCSLSKNTAIDSVLRLLHEDDKNVMIAVAQGIVPVLVRLLDSNSPETKEKSVAAISRVSAVDSSKHVLVAEGLLLLNHLVRIVESGSVFAKEKACAALQALSFSKENARAIGSRGGISALLDICVGGTPGSQAVAAGVLRNLAQFEEIAENFMEENALSVLIPLTGSGTALARENAMGCLANLVRNDENLKLVVAREGGIERMKDYWGDSTPPVGRSLEPAVELLKYLASLRPVGDILIREGFIGRLHGVLSCGVLGARIAAAGAVYELGKCGKARREIGDARCMPPLVRMLEGKATEEREAAARALSKVLVCDHNKKLLKKEERGVLSLVMLLDPMTQKNLDKKYVVSALSLLASGSNKCRKMMVDANACVYLQKLVDLGNVEGGGAKKLLECLGGGRGKVWWGVFGRN